MRAHRDAMCVQCAYACAYHVHAHDMHIHTYTHLTRSLCGCRYEDLALELLDSVRESDDAAPLIVL